MTTRSPPRVATWLLEELGGGTRIEELVGDLTEQFAAGRSRLWYWRQAGGALAVAVGRALRTHATSFTAAVLAGYALTSLWLFGNSLAFGSLYRSLDAHPHPLTLETVTRFLGMRAAQASLTVLTFVSGWIVTRIHRAHQRAVLLAFVVSVIAQRVVGILQLVANGVTDSHPSSGLIPSIVSTGLQGVFTFVVGLWVIQRERIADMKPHIRVVALLTLLLTVGSSLLYDLWMVGVMSYRAAERYPVDAAEIASGACLAFLLWRRQSRSTLVTGVV